MSLGDIFKSPQKKEQEAKDHSRRITYLRKKYGQAPTTFRPQRPQRPGISLPRTFRRDRDGEDGDRL